MNVLIVYIQKIFALFLLLVVARQLIPNGRLKKYIYFFTELVLIIGVMQPFFSFWGDNDALLDKIRSETFTENLSEASRDIRRMEYLRNDYYRREYENAAALDVKGTAEGYLEQFGFMVKQSSVELTENYEVRKIILTVAEKEARDTEGIFVEQGKAQGSQIVLDELKQKLVQYYGVKEDRIQISYGGEGGRRKSENFYSRKGGSS